jgi:hypothetical protein
MSPEVSYRLMRIVPRFLVFEQKYDLIQKLWNRYRQNTTLQVTISRHDGLEAAVRVVMDAVDRLDEHEIPPAIADRLEWLAQDDAVAAQALLAEVDKREGEIAVGTLEEELRHLLALANQHSDKHVQATRTVTLPGIKVCVNVVQSSPTAERGHPVSDLSKAPGDQSRRDLAPIQNPSDILGWALQNMPPEKRAEVIGKATDEAVRIQVKQADAAVDAKRAKDALDDVADRAADFGRPGQEFEIRRVERLEHGRVEVTVKSKPEPVAQRAGCFVAVACLFLCPVTAFAGAMWLSHVIAK